jgi:hypothetical protein
VARFEDAGADALAVRAGQSVIDALQMALDPRLADTTGMVIVSDDPTSSPATSSG